MTAIGLYRRPGRRRSLRHRRVVNRLMELVAWLSALLAIAILALIVASVAVKAAGALTLDFFTKNPATFGETGGGIANAIVGTALLVALAGAIAIPVGILIAIYTSQFADSRMASVVRFALDLLNGVPTIITGIFVFTLLVVGHTQSGIAGAIALAIIMLPLVARGSHEALALVPDSLKEAGLALGARRWRTVLRVVLPTAFGGMLTASLLAVARAAGETAPLLFTSSIAAGTVSTNVAQALPSIPVTIFTYSESPNPSQHQQAWAAALVLMLFVLLVNVFARAVSARRRGAEAMR